MSKKPHVAWQPDDPAVPVQQGDLLLAAWAKTTETGTTPSIGYPRPGQRDDFYLRFWDDQRLPLLEMWGCLNYALVTVVADDCAIDKKFHLLREQYIEKGMAPGAAHERAHDEADPYVAVAEVWPVEDLPEYVRHDAESGALGYVPCTLSAINPEDQRVYAADLNRISTISWRSIDRRMGMRTERWQQKLQADLCRFFAARTIRVQQELSEIFNQPALRVEALTPPTTGNPPKTRARIHLADGTAVTVEAILDPQEPEQEPGSDRPGLITRR